MIVITGATGALNGATVDHLLESVPAERIAVAVRDVGKAQRLADAGVKVRHGDFADRCPRPSPEPSSCCSSPPAIPPPTP